jgi:internalin A
MSARWAHSPGSPHSTCPTCTGLTDVGPLGTLTGLTTLDLSSCQGLRVRTDPEGCLPTLKGVAPVSGQPHRSPHAICGEDTGENVLDAVRAYYDDLGADPEGDAELKVFLLGNGRVGKTKLARRLQGQDYGADHEPSTHGVRLGRFPRRCRAWTTRFG